LAGVAGALVLSLIFLQFMSHFQYWSEVSFLRTFLFLYFFLGICYIGLSFNAFRSKDKSIAYLMLPVSNLEKYLYEFLTRIVAYVILMPLIYWIVANLEGVVIHHYVPEFVNYKFSFSHLWNDMNLKEPISGWKMLAFFQGSLFVFIAAFAGASHFSKSPLVKTLFTFSIIAGGYALFTYLLFKGLNIKEYSPSSSGVLWINSKESFTAFFAVVAAVVNLSFLAIAWFRLKEKEV
jgi:hypothetical protein